MADEPERREPTAYNLPAEAWREVAVAAVIRIDGYKVAWHEPTALLKHLCWRAWGTPEGMNG